MNDIGFKEPNFEMLKEFILRKARLAQTKFVYYRDRATMANNSMNSSMEILSTSATPVNPITATETSSAKLEIIMDSVADLTEKISQFDVLLQAKKTRHISKASSSLRQIGKSCQDYPP